MPKPKLRCLRCLERVELDYENSRAITYAHIMIGTSAWKADEFCDPTIGWYDTHHPSMATDLSPPAIAFTEMCANFLALKGTSKEYVYKDSGARMYRVPRKKRK